MLSVTESDKQKLLTSLYYILFSDQYKPILTLVKGFRNGIVYGGKVRIPHSLVMTFLFKEGSLLEKLKIIANATITHSSGLALMVTGYKMLTYVLLHFVKENREYYSVMIGGLMGFMIFGRYNKVNEQINLYLLSRIVQGLTRYGIQKGYIPQSNRYSFRLFALTVWGIVMWLFSYHKDTLQPSLQSSMTYLYEDSNNWTSIRNFIWHNK